MHRRPSILSYRPKTSSAADDATSHHATTTTTAAIAIAIASPATMKRTASQTFSSHVYDPRDGPMALGAVTEGLNAPADAVRPQTHSSSLSRALVDKVTCNFSRQKSRRRMSSLSSIPSAAPRRRGSMQGFIDSLPSSTVHRPITEPPCPQPLHHQDSAMPSSSPHPLVAPPPSKTFSLRRLGSLRHRPSTSASSRDMTKPSCAVATPFSSHTVPGAAARQAAAAANQDRQNQLRREQEHTMSFLNGLIPSMRGGADMKDDESGVDMTCASPMVRADSMTSKTNLNKTIDPFQRLPAELATAVLSNLDAASVVCAERVSHSWNQHASSPHVWRSVFLRQFQPDVHAIPTPIQMGGVGIGKLAGAHPAPAQNWKKMFQARKVINNRWKAATPAAIYLNGHTDSVYCCQFDENKAITGSRDRTIRVWDLKTYKCLKVYGGPSHRPTANTPPSMEERSERVISNASLNGTKTGDSIYRVPSDYHDASILCLQYDSEIMVTGSSDYTCIVWDITGEDYVPTYRLRGHEAGVLDVCLDDKYIISCSKDAMIKVWDRKTGICVRTLRGHRGPVNAVQLRGNKLVSASGDGMAKLWDLETGESKKDFPSEDRGLAAVEFSDDAKYVLAGGNDHVVYKFDANTGTLVHSRVKHDGLVRSLFLDAFNGRIVSGSYDQSIQVSDYETGQTFATYKNWTTSWILSAKSDYRRVVATSQDGRTLILDFGYNVPGAELLVGS